MGDLCPSAVVKVKTHQMANGREIKIGNIVTREQMKHKWWEKMTPKC